MTTTTQKDYLYVLSNTPRFLSTQFTPSVLSLFLFYVDRTLRFNKTTESISNVAYKYGITSKKGDPIVGPLGMAESTIRRAKKELENMGLIRVISGTGKQYSKITLVLREVKKLIKKEMKRMTRSMLKKPKKARKTGGVKKNTQGCQKEHPKVVESKVIESKNIKQTETSVSGSSVAKTKQKEIRDRRRINVDKVDVISRKNLLLIWAEGMCSYREEHASAVPIPVTGKNISRHVNVMRKVFTGRDVEWKDFLYRAITEWDILIPHFSWINSKSGIPSVPDLGFITSFYKQIISAQQEQLKIDSRNKAQKELRMVKEELSRKEQDEVDKENKRLRYQLAQVQRSNENLTKELVKTTGRLNRKEKEKLKPMSDKELMEVEDLPTWEEVQQNNIH